ncbi:hypothetical protein [Parasphingopyxis lamellibrachiae]|uniref:DUF4129 domain-containing protein n=1 Tax=Parasphingopyxis lamellibrachiae TaxID=680125 RepID=A0A3D9FG62_9SPHN|nr:hypothetical protein [Parasphingopyxis lamellibrachiae]RED16527.1 hypothetical protein DFR46_1551 [Parasphingopyxis lamellibrachiae]
MTAAAPPTGNENAQTFDQAYRELIESDRFQTEMTEFEPPVPREPPDWLADLLRWLETLGPVWQGLFWIVVGGLAAIILFSIGRALYRRFSDPAASDEEDEAGTEHWRPEAKAAHGLLGEADAMAKQGRYAEAAHLLLFRSIADIEERLPDFMRPALTSRDISDAAALPAPARTAFSSIAHIVERGIFAVQPVDEQGWAEARSAYEQFAFGKSWA